MEKGYLGIRKEITFLIKYAGRSHRIYKENSFASVMVSVLVSSAIDRGSDNGRVKTTQLLFGTSLLSKLL